MTDCVLAIIGGSGLYSLPELEDVRETARDTPFGAPSSPIVEGRIGATRLLFLTRHGRGHRLLPQEVNYRANIFALRQLGATHVVSISAVGSLQEDIRPGDLAVPAQYIDRTKGRPSTFFGGGLVGHVNFADPVCPELAELLATGADHLHHRVHRNTTLVTMEGPAFSTRAESRLHRLMGGDLIGMTAMPEAKLAREAELCYATLALATDYDAWRESEESVTVEQVVATLHRNVEKARAMVVETALRIGDLPRRCPCPRALDNAILTDRAAIAPELTQRMKPVFGRVL
jgi:5'-methylthioadenosine phosphorylase